MHAAWIPQLFTLAGVVLAGLLTVWGSHIVSKRNARSADRTADAAVQQAINDGFSSLTEGFTHQLNEARAEITDLRGWIRELIQHIDSLEGMLREHAPAVPIPPRRALPHPLSVVKEARS